MEIADHSHAREENTNIHITREGHWFTGDKKIVNFRVVSHFKQSLFRDAKGIYVYQTFRQFAEKGYITVKGPLLHVFRIDRNEIMLDSLDTLPTASAKIYQNTEDEALYLYYERLDCYASIPAAVAPALGELLSEDNGVVYFNGKPVASTAITAWSGSAE